MKPIKESDNRSTVGGPSRREGAPANEFTAKLAATQELTAAMPYNTNKALEYGEVSATPEKGQAVEPPDPGVTGSTLTEDTSSDKTGAGEPQLGFNPANKSLDRVRVDSSGRALTTNQGVPVGGQPEFVKSRIARPGAAGGLHPPREDHAFRS